MYIRHVRYHPLEATPNPSPSSFSPLSTFVWHCILHKNNSVALKSAYIWTQFAQNQTCQPLSEVLPLISQGRIFLFTDLNCKLQTFLWVKSIIVIIFFNSSPPLHVCLLFFTPSWHGSIWQNFVRGRWLECCLGDMTRPACVYVIGCFWNRWCEKTTTTRWVGFWGWSRFSAKAKLAMKLEILKIGNLSSFHIFMQKQTLK